MYAIVKTGGKQYRVERGQTLLVERLPGDEGDTVALQPVLYRSQETIFDSQGLGRVQVKARVLGHERGPKIRVFKFKPKRGYRRTTGHRQELTRIEVTDIGVSGARARSSASEAPDKPAATKAPAKAARAKTGRPKTPAASKAPASASENKETGDGS